MTKDTDVRWLYLTIRVLKSKHLPHRLRQMDIVRAIAGPEDQHMTLDDTEQRRRVFKPMTKSGNKN